MAKSWLSIPSGLPISINHLLLSIRASDAAWDPTRALSRFIAARMRISLSVSGRHVSAVMRNVVNYSDTRPTADAIEKARKHPLPSGLRQGALTWIAFVFCVFSPIFVLLGRRKHPTGSSPEGPFISIVRPWTDTMGHRRSLLNQRGYPANSNIAGICEIRAGWMQ